MKRLLFLIVLFGAFTSSIWAQKFSADYNGNTIYYQIISSTSPRTVGVTYQGYGSSNHSYSGNVVIPSSVTYGGDTYSVTSIGSGAFSGCESLASITIPNSVTSIGYGAFRDCPGLTSVSLGNSVTSIGEAAFKNCIGLASITIPNSVTSIGREAFLDCSGLTSVSLGNSVTSIGDLAFWRCTGLASITIPNSVTSIGYGAFNDCSGLVSVSIGNSVTSIGGSAFCGCESLASINIPNSVTSIGAGAFSLCTGLTSITIPNSVTSIGSTAFYNCTGLTSITIPNSVTSIERWTFFGCTGLTSVTIPNSITSIGDNAFAYCTGLTSITIPNSVTSIEKRAFAANNLNTITVSSGNTMYDSRNNCNAIIETSSNMLTTGCKNTIIPNSVTSIGDGAFYGCIGLTSITIPNSVTSIGKDVFYECTDLTNITIPNSVTSIEYTDFYGCTGLTSITIPNSVTSIGVGAFYGCVSLASITIPNSVTSIGGSAFSGCTGLTSITSLAITAPQLENDVFKDVNDSIPVYFPCGSLQSYSSAWPNFSNFIEIVPYSFSVTSANDTMGEVSVLAQPTCSSPSATIQAEANTGYRFTHWSDGETNNPRIVNVTSDTTIIAHFDVVNGIETNESLVQIYEQGGSFYINGAEGETLAIYDVYGRVIYQGTAEDNKPYEMPQPGVYMVKVGNNPAQKDVIK